MTTLIGYEWRLREQMAAAGLFTTTKLIPLLDERGVHLSASQVYRLVTDKPERLNLTVLVALTDILGCAVDDLIVRVDLGHQRDTGDAAKVAGESAAAAIRDRGLRPRRARITE